MKKLTLEEFIIKANVKHNNKYDYSLITEYVNSQTKIPIKDKETNDIFYMVPAAHLQGQGNPNLRYVKSSETFKKNNSYEKIKHNFMNKYGVENPFQLEEVKNKIKKFNIEQYGFDNVSKSSIIKEKKRQTFNNNLLTNLNFISDINNKKIITSIKKYGTTHPTQSNEIKNRIKETQIKKYNNHNTRQHLSNSSIDIFNDIDKLKVFMQDKSASEAAAILGYHFSEIYKKCKKYNISYVKKYKIEGELENFLIQNNIKFIKNDRKIIAPKEVDFYLPDYKIAIEIHGLYWHSYEILSSKRIDGKYYHKNKYDLSIKNGIELIQIFEDEWKYKKNIIIKLIRNKLNISNDIKISARKTKVVELSFDEVKDFLNKNHYIGESISSVYLGLTYNDVLVAVMTFKKEFDVWNLTRYATSCIVRGGASKLLKYFENKYNPKIIKTFADLRLSSGNLYRTLGFKQEKNIAPDYYYIINGVRKHKFNFRVSTKNISESQIMKNCKIYKIYDSGKIKFIKFYKL
jgi:NADH:ubiquinone oxidoreductase subunit E